MKFSHECCIQLRAVLEQMNTSQSALTAPVACSIVQVVLPPPPEGHISLCKCNISV